MPRVSGKLVKQAARVSPLLPYLLRANPSLAQAQQELKWIQAELPKHQWKNAVKRRNAYEPLQYILESQPFGSLDIICEKGVLIPRWETEEWCLKLSSVLSILGKKNLSILDSCTGTGCIPLLLNYELNQLANLNSHIRAFDISSDAYRLSKRNHQAYSSLHPSSATNIKFIQANLFSESIVSHVGIQCADLITSNPPYIPAHHYHKSVGLDGISRSVREYEPAEALIGHMEFYEALINNLVKPLSASGFVFELGYQEQADYVYRMLKDTEEWRVGVLKDSASNIRCVLGWKSNSPMRVLGQLCSSIYS
ncbi:S-adenosyl-L-methionine-dependent methyltransferase [Scheffersomyces amazonensis]|uniref:S-adenosyl-L-methionine-dependent methyltransferase n=1 Tax=Scheffersomyces amazonensis TaxID=1078765 RepID=UPI00315D449B